MSGDVFDQTKSVQSSELVYSVGDASHHLATGTKPTSKFESPATASPLRPQTIFAGQQKHMAHPSAGSFANMKNLAPTEGTLMYSASLQQSNNGGYGLDSGFTANGGTSNRLLQNFLTESGTSPVSTAQKRPLTDNM